MFILAHAEPLENCKNNEYRIDAGRLVKQYLDGGYQIHERRYRIKDRHKEYTVVCPEFRKAENGAEPVVIIPEFLVPRRPYPVYVYLYAIDLYSNTPEKGQRWAAEATRRHFGLESFSHTTLGRALKAFVRRMCGRGSEAPENDGAEAANTCEAPSFPVAQATAELRKLAAQWLRGMPMQEGRAEAAAACCRLARRRFAECQRFLL